MQLEASVRDAQCDNLVDLIDAGAGAGTITFHTTAFGTLLATLTSVTLRSEILLPVPLPHPLLPQTRPLTRRGPPLFTESKIRTVPMYGQVMLARVGLILILTQMCGRPGPKLILHL